MATPAGVTQRVGSAGPVVMVALVVTAALQSGCDGNAFDAQASPRSRPLTAAEPMPAVRYVQLEALSEANGQPWTAMAEFNLIDSTGAVVPRTRWKVSADSADANDSPEHAIDGNAGSLWHTQWNGASPPPPHRFTVDLGAPVRLSGFRYLPRQDALGNGHIAQFRLLVSHDGVQWSAPVASGDLSTLGPPRDEKVVVFGKQTGNHAPLMPTIAAQDTDWRAPVSLRIAATDPDSDTLSYSADGLPPGLGIGAASGIVAGTANVAGSFRAVITVQDGKGASSTLPIAWTVRPPGTPAVDAAAAPGTVRYVKLEALSELGGQAWTSVAEFNLLDADGKALPRKGWTASADSSDANDAVANAIDGDPATLWHTRWDGDAAPLPHSFVVDLHASVKLGGFRLLPRQDAIRNGTIARYRFYVSADGTHWGTAVAEGDLSQLGAPTAEKTVRLK